MVSTWLIFQEGEGLRDIQFYGVASVANSMLQTTE